MTQGNLLLSVVDQAPIHDGGPAARAPFDSVRLAKACEALGYHRYWLAEHHNTPGYACPAPEILIGHIAQATQRMRVGSGGVMLPHYSPYKVAEVFRMLATLHPGRIDLGVGRAPGGDQMATAALAWPHHPHDPRVYPQQVYDIIGYLHDTLPEEHPYQAARVVPEGPDNPEVWMLGSSDGSAEVAGQLGAALVLALFIGTHPRSPAILEAYRRAFQPSAAWQKPRAAIAVAAICADSEAEARRIAATRSMWIFQALYQGRMGKGLPDPDEAMAMAEQLPAPQRAAYDAILNNTVLGTPQQCREQIEAVAGEYDVEEVMVVAVTYRFADRLRSYELLAEAFDLSARQAKVAA